MTAPLYRLTGGEASRGGGLGARVRVAVILAALPLCLPQPVVEYVVKHTPDLDGATACGFLIQQCYDGAAAPRLEWALDRDMGIKPWARVRNAMIDVVSAAIPTAN